MIPKIIHYCWFGGNPLPKSALKCINSWKKFFPDYEIKEWNETNFDVNMMPFTKEAYTAKKYAFVSDVARFYILYEFGGLYFDTDVEVIREFDDVLEHDAFMGIETPMSKREPHPWINPGLGLGTTKGNFLIGEILKYYRSLHFCDQNGIQTEGTVVTHTTNVLIKHGLQNTNDIQNVKGVVIYPKEYFNPLEDSTGIITKTHNTHSIHWYSKSWIENYGPIRAWVTRYIHRFFGVDSLFWLKDILKKL